METHIQHYNHIMKRATAYFETRSDICAAVVVGSRSRAERLADEWSDLDIMLYVEQPDVYLDDSSWLSELGDIWQCIESQTVDNDPEFLLILAGGLCVDVVVCPGHYLQGMLGNRHFADIFRRGARILLDRDGLVRQILADTIPTPPVQIPSQEAFLRTGDTFGHLTFYIAKQLRRGDLWMVMVRDCQLKQLLMRMIEWHTHAHAPEGDIWHEGRFIETWTEPRIQDALPECFGRYNTSEQWQALLNTLGLFTWIERETAAQLGYAYPEERRTRLFDLVRHLHAGGFLGDR